MRRIIYASFLRIMVFVGLFYILVQILLAPTNGIMEMNGKKLKNSDDTSEQVLAQLYNSLTSYPENVVEIDTTPMPTPNFTFMNLHKGNPLELAGPKNITDMMREIQRINEEQTIYNEDIFGPVQNDTIIIAIQVHTRLTYLRHLIVSLAQARDIDKTLLIFSHDYYDEEINNLVKSIDFTKVMQIFYPYSIQTHPNEFPGIDPNDCPRDAKLQQAIKLKCNNALHPDVHGHYREANYTQTKHHWWWKANRIFNQLQSTAAHTGMVVFLEEDHYVAEDFIHMIHILQGTRNVKCPHCEILCLGTYLKPNQYTLQLFTAHKVEITPWRSSLHNMGFAFNKTVWENIVELQDQFCDYDDYNWDYSLLHLSQNRPGREKFKVILCNGPRVFHIGECGLHHKTSNCNVSTVISKVQKLLNDTKSYMYPAKVTATVTTVGSKAKKNITMGNGGWGDLRDRELCTNMTKIGRQIRKYHYDGHKNIRRIRRVQRHRTF